MMKGNWNDESDPGVWSRKKRARLAQARPKGPLWEQ